MKKHFLKIEPRFYIPVEKGIKTFEVRLNDRDYQVGDVLILREFTNGEYTGRVQHKRITYILQDLKYVQQGYVVLAFENYLSPDFTYCEKCVYFDECKRQAFFSGCFNGSYI